MRGKEPLIRVQESHEARPLAAAFKDVLEKSHNPQPLAQAFAQATQQQSPVPSPPPASGDSTKS